MLVYWCWCVGGGPPLSAAWCVGVLVCWRGASIEYMHGVLVCWCVGGGPLLSICMVRWCVGVLEGGLY